MLIVEHLNRSDRSVSRCRREADEGGRIVERLIEHSLTGRFTFPELGGLRAREIEIRGKADRIDVFDDGSLRVIDYKLGRMPDVETSIQIGVYAHAARELLERRDGRPHPVAAAMYLAFGEERRLDGRLGRLRDRAGRLDGSADRLRRRLLDLLHHRLHGALGVRRRLDGRDDRLHDLLHRLRHSRLDRVHHRWHDLLGGLCDDLLGGVSDDLRRATEQVTLRVGGGAAGQREAEGGTCEDARTPSSAVRVGGGPLHHLAPPGSRWGRAAHDGS